MQITEFIKPVTDSVIGWLGGKTKLRTTIINSFPPHHCYVEVFCGSATVFFGKPPSKVEIINDVHSELVNLMKVISGTYFDENIRNEFIDYVRNMPASRELHTEWKYWNQEQIDKLNPAQRAYRFYYCIKKGFSSIAKGGYEASPMSGSRLNMNSNFEPIASRFRATNAQIENLDFVTLVEKYNRPLADTFFFMDPPYFVANGTNYYDFTFTEEQHLQLLKCCNTIDENNNKFLITYDDVPEVINLYKHFFIYRTDPIIYAAADERGSRGLSKTELFVSNYDIAKTIGKNKNIDMFESGGHTINDNKIDFVGHIGLERVV